MTSKPFFRATGLHRIDFGERRGDDNRPDIEIRFVDRKGRSLSDPLDVRGLQLNAWTVQEGIYSDCDEVRVLSKNADGEQLEFGAFVVQFLRSGRVVGEHLADSVIVSS